MLGHVWGAPNTLQPEASTWQVRTPAESQMLTEPVQANEALDEQEPEVQQAA